MKVLTSTVEQIISDHDKIKGKVSLLENEIVGYFRDDQGYSVSLIDWRSGMDVLAYEPEDNMPARYEKDIKDIIKTISEKGFFTVEDMDDATELPF